MLETWKTSWIVTSALVVSAISVLIWKKTRRTYVKVGKISKLYFYPVKSLKAVEVTEGVCTNLGFVVNGILDRSFMLIDAEGRLVSQREAPTLVLLTPSIRENNLFIRTPNGAELKVPIKDSVTPGDKMTTCYVHSFAVDGVDCGDEAAAFFQTYLQLPDVRLVRYFSTLPERKYIQNHPYYIKVSKDHPVGFQDLAALHLVSQASVEDLNAKMDGYKVTPLTFRPNILITGCKAFEEDSWRYIKFPSGAESFHILTTTRCLMTTNDVETGVLSKKEPLVTLRKYRIHEDPEYFKKTGSIPCIGISHAVLKHGEIHVGEEIFADVGPQHAMKNKLAG